MVLVNQPGASRRTVDLPEGTAWTDGGNSVSSVTLDAREGAVLRDEGENAGTEPSAEDPAVTLRPARTRVHRGRRVKLSGNAPTAATVTVYARRKTTWRRLATGVPVAGDSFKLRTRARRAGVVRYRAVAEGLERSRKVRVRVRR
jgi:hypothetical protein